MQEQTAATLATPRPHVEVLPSPSAATFQELLVALREGSVETRADAARQLRDFAPECVEPLCAALKDTEEPVRSAAAESLGLIGDERAVQHLVEALKAGFPGKSARRHRVVAVLACITVPLALIAGVAMLIATKGEGFGDALLNANWFSGGGKVKVHNTRAIAQALTKIADRSPTPGLREALPELREIAADSIQQDKRSRAASRAAARKIDALTTKLDALPVVATAPGLDEATLPRAATTREASSNVSPGV